MVAAAKLLVKQMLGDSIAAASGCHPFQWVGRSSRGDAGSAAVQASQIYQKAGSVNAILQNLAVAGTKLTGTDGVGQQMTNYVLPSMARLTYPGARQRVRMLGCAIGSNDGARGIYATATLYANAVAAALQPFRTAGGSIIALYTLLPRNLNMAEVDRLEYNACLTSSVWRIANSIDYVIDLASDTIMGDPANLSDATWYLQEGGGAVQVHPTTAGHIRLNTNIVTPTMSTIMNDWAIVL